MAEKQSQLNEQRVAAASFILNFYNEVLQLKGNYAVYRNVVLQLETKNKQGGVSEGADKDSLLQAAQTMRYYIILSYMDYKALFNYFQSENKNLKADETINNLVNKIDSTLILECKDVEAFIDAINKFLISAVIKRILETSQDIVDGVYS